MLKIIDHFDQLATVWLKAVMQDSTSVTDLSNRLSLPHHQLYEVWLIPENELAFSKHYLDKACYNNVQEIVNLYDFEVTPSPLYAQAKQLALLASFAINLSHADSRWNYSVLQTDDGPVISIVFGSILAMKIMYDQGLRTL